MGDDHRGMECCERDCVKDCRDRCLKECYCEEENDNNIIGLILLILVIYCLFCNGNGKGGLFGGLF